MTKRSWLVVVAMLFPLAARAEVDKKAERLWKTKCASCHGADGKAQTEQGQKAGLGDATTAAWQSAHTDAQIKTAISDGVKGKKGEMEAFKAKLSAEQIDSLVAYLRSIKA